MKKTVLIFLVVLIMVLFAIPVFASTDFSIICINEKPVEEWQPISKTIIKIDTCVNVADSVNAGVWMEENIYSYGPPYGGKGYWLNSAIFVEYYPEEASVKARLQYDVINDRFGYLVQTWSDNDPINISLGFQYWNKSQLIWNSETKVNLSTSYELIDDLTLELNGEYTSYSGSDYGQASTNAFLKYKISDGFYVKAGSDLKNGTFCFGIEGHI